MRSVHRCDRDISLKQSGGGVLIAVNAKLKSEQLVADRTDVGFEQVWTKIQLGDGLVHAFAVVYFSPGSRRDQFEWFFRCVQQVMASQSSDVQIYGDFNQRNAMFKPDATNECLLIPE
ncbi:hypothetical protein pipiens_008589 [Culex pipiens pipiens]|uniref:Endonuclease/exonuclease/phosphatase domain-containing protein n=1 Tax=Culex pipiens pipiens TaxID=38569 RepID=A0ABD1DGW5_CULPP